MRAGKRLLAEIDFLERALFFERKLLGVLRSRRFQLSGLYLDVGCGGATFTAIFSKYFRETIGLDISSKLLRRRKNLLKRHNVHCHFILAEARRLPVREELIDAVSAFSIVEHLRDPSEFFKEVRGVVKKEGIVIIYVPNGLFLVDPHTGIPFAPIIPARVKNWYAKTLLKYSYPTHYLSEKRVLKLCESYFERTWAEKVHYPSTLLSRARSRDQTRSFYTIMVSTILKILKGFPSGYLFVCRK